MPISDLISSLESKLKLKEFSQYFNEEFIKTLQNAGSSLGMHPANERRRYSVTTSLIGRAHT